jgi:hypothetical protein
MPRSASRQRAAPTPVWSARAEPRSTVGAHQRAVEKGTRLMFDLLAAQRHHRPAATSATSLQGSASTHAGTRDYPSADAASGLGRSVTDAQERPSSSGRSRSPVRARRGRPVRVRGQEPRVSDASPCSRAARDPVAGARDQDGLHRRGKSCPHAPASRMATHITITKVSAGRATTSGCRRC